MIKQRWTFLALILAMLAACVALGPSSPANATGPAPSSSAHRVGSFPVLTWAGDLAGSTNLSQTVAALQGHTLPAPTGTNTLLTWSGSALSWSNLGVSALTPGTAGQFIVTNSGATAATWASCSQDIACSTSTVGQMALQSITPTGGTGTTVPVHASGFQTDNTISSFTFSTNKSGGTLNLNAGVDINVAALTSPSGTSTNVQFNSPNTSNVGSININDNGFFAINSSVNQLSMNGSSGIGITTYSASTIAIADNGAVGYGQLKNSGWIVGPGANAGTFIQSAPGNTSLTLGTNNSAGILALQAGAASNVIELAAGTQGGTALGANMASTGHYRYTNAWRAYTRNAANNADLLLLIDDGADNIALANGAYSSVSIGSSSVGTASINASTSATLGSNTIMHGATNALTENLNATGASNLTWAAGVTGVTYTQAQASGAGATTTMSAQAGASGGSAGGILALKGGVGSGTVNDGAVQIGTSGALSKWTGGLSVTVRHITTTDTANASQADYVLSLDSTSGVFTETLPAPWATGAKFEIVNTAYTGSGGGWATHNVTLSGGGGHNINTSATTKVLSGAGQPVCEIISYDGTNWMTNCQ